MKLYIKQKVFKLAPEFTVKDAAGNDRWFVQGKWISLDREHTIYNTAGQPVARIYREVFRLMHHYHLEIQGREVAEIVRQFSLFRPRFDITGSGLQVEGDWFAHDYTVFAGNAPIMHISKEWFTWGDSYVLDIADPQHELLALGVALAIDTCLADDNNH
ncbi:MAG: hypothetical protein LBN05_04455 [Oscillospiraceae bacterium]|jgi:uncharacterized protein YxjI|nr:hypothetical protein [Oscillospiraceae bacterium]